MPSIASAALSPRHEPLSPLAKRSVGAGAVGLHVAAVAWLVIGTPMEPAQVGEPRTLQVEWIAAPAPPAPPVTQPPPPVPQPAPAQPPRPTVVSTPRPTPAPAPFVAPPPEPVAPAPAVAAAPAPHAPPAPPAPPPPPPAAPRTVSVSEISFLTPPQLDYPLASRRAREQGQARVRVLVDAQGRPQQMELLRSTGSTRLDEAALAAVRATRFKPYMENGVAQAVRVVMPLDFELEN